MGQQGFDWKQLYFSFEGRINRSTWWLKFWVPVMLLSIVTTLIDYASGSANEYGVGPVGSIMSILVLYSAIAVYVKRFHDRGRSGWFILLLLVPVLNLWPAVEMLFLRGTVGENRYGPDPD